MALTSTWSSIVATQTDADSPVDVTLMDAIRQDINVLYEWIGGQTYTPSTSHRHTGTDSAKILEGDITKSAGVSMFEDFLGGGQYNWTPLAGTSFVATPSTVSYNGVAQCISSANSYAGGYQADLPWLMTSSNNITFEARVKRGATAPTGSIAGLHNSNNPGGGLGNAICFTNDSSGYYVCNNSKSGVGTSSNPTTVLLSTAYQTLKIVTSGITNVKFYIDNVLLFTDTSHIPVAGMGVILGCNSGDATQRSMNFDYVSCASDARV